MTRIEEILQRLFEATPGPWIAKHNEYFSGLVVETPLRNKSYPEGPVCWQQTLTYDHREREAPDALFIAHARSDIPFLIERLEQWRRAMEAAKTYIAQTDPTHSRRRVYQNLKRLLIDLGGEP